MSSNNDKSERPSDVKKGFGKRGWGLKRSSPTPEEMKEKEELAQHQAKAEQERTSSEADNAVLTVKVAPVCQKCQIELMEGARFCTECGTLVPEPNTTPVIPGMTPGDSWLTQSYLPVPSRKLGIFGSMPRNTRKH